MRTPITLTIILLPSLEVFTITRIPTVEAGREYVKINGDWRWVDGKPVYTCTLPRGAERKAA